MAKTCAIIGAGIAGIASAIRMANKGYQVEVWEANGYLGGKLSEFSQMGYRFDAGPSLFTMPHFVDALFKLSQKNPTDYFQYKRLEINCKYFYEDGTILNAYADIEKFAEEVSQKTQDTKDTIRKFLKKSKTIYDITAEVFLHRSLHKWQNYLNKSTLWGVFNFAKIDAFRTMSQANTHTFRDAKMVQFFNRYATYNGSNPYQTPATMNIIPYLEFGIGAFFPQGGMYQITDSLYRLAKDLGVVFHLNTKVEEILVKEKKAIGLKIANQNRLYDCIISNMDIVGTYRKLLPQHPAPQKLLSQPKSSSALIFYWGIKHPFPELELHNIFFSQDYEKEFYHLFQQKDIFEDPTIYLNISSKEAPQDAPIGCENWFVMVNAPNNTGQNWDEIIAKTKKNILQKLSKMLKADIASMIECESILDPRSIEARTSSSQGALYGNSSNNRFAAFLRHANFSSAIQNLYFCGGSVHPGGGIPLCLLSAKIATDLIPSTHEIS